MRTSDFQRLKRTLLCQQPDYVPVMELQIDPPTPERILGRKIETLSDKIDFWKTAGYDYYICNPRHAVSKLKDQADTPISYTETSDSGSPAERKWANEHKGLITCRDDLKKLTSVQPDQNDYQELVEAKKLLPDSMGLIVQIGGFFEEVWQLMGFENFVHASMDTPDLLDTLWDWSSTAIMNHFHAIMDYDIIDALWLCDDIAYTESLMVSPTLLRKRIFPCHKQIAQVCRQRGLPVLYHSDGDLTAVMDDLLDVGINALHPIEPKAMDIYEMKKKYAGRLALVGNIDLGSTLVTGTPDEVRQDVRRHIKELAPGGGYCVSSSNTIPNYVPLENYRAMLEATFEYGRYPIK